MDEFVCPWCGEDLIELMASMPFDTALEAHVESCEPYLAEQNLAEKNNYMSPLCDEEE